MRRFAILVLSFVLIATWGQSALGFGRFGATDLMNVPTSGTLSEGAYGLHGNFSGGLAMLGMDFGLVPDLELGVTAYIGDNWQSASLRAKYHLLTEKRDGLGLAIGLQDVGSDTISPYVVAGKTLAHGMQGYLGVGGGQMNGFFFGLDKELPSLRGARLFLEFDGQNINLGGRFKLAKNTGLDIGLAGLDSVAVGISYVSRF